MALKPKEEIGAEVHKLDQFFRVEEGNVTLAVLMKPLPWSGLSNGGRIPVGRVMLPFAVN